MGEMGPETGVKGSRCARRHRGPFPLLPGTTASRPESPGHPQQRKSGMEGSPGWRYLERGSTAVGYRRCRFRCKFRIEKGPPYICDRPMSDDLPRLDKTALSVGSLFDDDEEERLYWLSRTPAERLRHTEYLRRMNYGERATARLQRVLEIAPCPWC